MFAGLSDPRAYAFIPDEPPSDVDALRARYAVLARGGSRDGSELWLNWVIRRRADGALLGYTQATVRDGTAQVAYLVFPPHWRQGVGLAAVSLMLDALFAMNGIAGAEALVDTRNRASQALLARLGFTVVRRIEGADHFKGRPSDELAFALPRARWPGGAAGL
jgi:RimJ/RimL family protein N-acetyltransferase